MYKISVPVNCKRLTRMGREKVYENLAELGATRVFLATGPYFADKSRREEIMESLKENCAYFKEKGLEVGAWNWSSLVEGKCDFTYMKTLDGQEQAGFCCFADEKFRDFAGEYIKDFARCGVDMILFDDDYRYGFQGGMNCTCKKHMAAYERITGESFDTSAHFRDKVLCGGKNKYRDAFLDVNGKSLCDFAASMRNAVNEVNPSVRLGLCSCMSVWDTDGADSEKIARLLAGDTKPFLRLIGAPYWAVNKGWGNRLQNIIELVRMERSWCGNGMEIVTEGDTYPRPRHFVPSSFLEIYDTSLRAACGFDGILKYGLDYYAQPEYERGYIKAHIKNKELYDNIPTLFDGKECVGVRVYEAKEKLRDMELYDGIKNCNNVQNLFFSPSSRMVSDNSIPTVYSGEGTGGIAFGENVKFVPKEALKRGLVTDIRGAMLLEKRGIDTGLVSVGKKVTAFEEHFLCDDSYSRAAYSAFLVTLKENAEVDCEFFSNDGSGEFAGTDFTENTTVSPLSYMYKNKDGEKFFVFTFDAYFNDETAHRSYIRQKQLIRAFEKMSGESLPVKCLGNPDLYILAKKGENSLSAGLWNIFADGIDEAEITLDEEYKNARFINCQGTLSGNSVIIKRIEPYSMAAFEAEK